MLYARVIMAMERGDRQRAVAAVAEELALAPPDAEAVVDRLWRRRQQEIPAKETMAEPWYSHPLALVGILVVGLVFVVALTLLLSRP
ncbi:MAG: hypothetical protein HY321_06390 [Armatimonadetes bacterium]|nr:hypothetical protein [Armatimonadota bacterium]